MMNRIDKLGDAPVQPEYEHVLRALAEIINTGINDQQNTPSNGFILMLFPFGDNPNNRVNYISNARREDVLVMLKEQVKRFEGQPETKGSVQ